MGQQQSASRRHPLTSRQLAESGNNVTKAVRQHVLHGAATGDNQPDALGESPRSSAAVAAEDPFSASGGLIGRESSAGEGSARGMAEVCGMSVLEAVEGLSEAELLEFRDWLTSAWRCAKCGNEREDWTRRHRLRAIFEAVGMHQPSSAPLATVQPASSLSFPVPPAPPSPLLSPTPSATPPVPPRRPPVGSNRLSPANASALPPLSPTFGSSLDAHPRSFGSAEAHGKAHFSPHSAAALTRAADENAQGAIEQGGADGGLAERAEEGAGGGTGMAAGEAAEARTGYKLWGRKGGGSRNADPLALASLSAAAAANGGSGGGAAAAGGGLSGAGGGGMRPPPLRRTVTATAAMTSSLLSAAAAAFASPAHDLRPAQSSSSGSIPLNPVPRPRPASNDSSATSAESAGAVPPPRSPVRSADKPASGPLKAALSSSAGDAGDVRPPSGAQRFALGFSIPRTHSASRAPASGVPLSTPPPPPSASSSLSATSAAGGTSLHRGLSGRLKGALGGLGGLRRARSDAAQLAEMMAASGDLVGGNRDGGADGGAAVGGLGEIELLAATAEEGEGGKGGAEGDKVGSGLGGRRRRGRKKSLGQVGRSVSVHAGEQSPFGPGNGEYGGEGGCSAHSSGSSQQSQAVGGAVSGCPMGMGVAAASAAAAAAAAAAREGGSGRRPMPRSRSYETVAHVDSDSGRAGGGAWAGQGGERGEGSKGSPGRSSGGSAGGEAGRGEAERGEAGREGEGRGEVSMDRKMLRAITTAQMLLQSDQSAGAGRVFEHLLASLLDMTGSQFGLIGSVLFQANGSPYLKSHAASNIAWTEELQAWYRNNSHRGLVFTNTANLLGATLLSAAPVISNHPALDPRSGGVPPGHPLLSAFLGVPLIVGSEMIGMYALANRAGGYSRAMLQELEPLAASTAVMLQAVHERKRKRDAELRLLSVLQVARDGLMTVGGDGRVTWMNGAACALFGMEEQHGHADAMGVGMGALHVKAFIHSIEGSPHYLSLGLESFVGHMRRATGIRSDGSRVKLRLSVSVQSHQQQQQQNQQQQQQQPLAHSGQSDQQQQQQQQQEFVIVVREQAEARTAPSWDLPPPSRGSLRSQSSLPSGSMFQSLPPLHSSSATPPLLSPTALAASSSATSAAAAAASAGLSFPPPLSPSSAPLVAPAFGRSLAPASAARAAAPPAPPPPPPPAAVSPAAPSAPPSAASAAPSAASAAATASVPIPRPSVPKSPPTSGFLSPIGTPPQFRPTLSSAPQGPSRDGGGAGRLGGGIGEVAEVWENRRQRGGLELGSSPLEGFQQQQQQQLQPYQQFQQHQQYYPHPHQQQQQQAQQQDLPGQWPEGQVLFRKFGEEGSSTRGSSRRRSTGLMRFRSLDSAKQSSNFHNYVASLKS